MTTAESFYLIKRINESAKKSPLKAVSPIIKKYSGHRQGKIKKKLKFPRILHGGRSKQKTQIKPQLKTILPKANAGDVIILEPNLLPCALNLIEEKKKNEEVENTNRNYNEPSADIERKVTGNPPAKESSKINKTKLLPNNKKKIKRLKNLEACLELLESNTSTLKDIREQTFAENYLLRIQQKFKGKDENLYNQFIDLICDFQFNGISVCDLYRKIKTLFHSHSDLHEDFVAFLTPEQAIECGVFIDHLLLTAMTDFLYMTNIYFSKSPQQIRKIYSVVESLATKPNISTDNVMNAVLPLLKGNPVLRDYFLQLLPNGRPPEHFLTDFEEIEYSEINSDMSDEEDIMETVHLPEMEDPFGGDLCPCQCHKTKEEDLKQPVDHCMSCSMKFINGKIFIQHGKLLKPARVVFGDRDMSYHRDRLAPKLYPKRGKKRQRNTLFKDNLSPTKSCNLSSDEFKSDIEEDDKGRQKLGYLKVPRVNSKKSLSPKHSDKILPRSGLTETKSDGINSGEKPVFNKFLDLPLMKDGNKIMNDTKVEEGGVKSNEYDFITFLSNPKNETKHLEETNSQANIQIDLPKIDLEDKLENNFQKSLKVKFEDQKLASVYLEKERSHSPPVISIPETAAPMFSNAKPIFSLLENLDDSKDSLMVIDKPKKKISGEQASSSADDVIEVKIEENISPWKIEEDRIILQTLQVENNCDETFVKIGQNIPWRSVEDIKKRFAELMNILYEMKSKTCNG